jgi:antitoxin HigA-1
MPSPCTPRTASEARGLTANRLAIDLGVPSGRIPDILNGRRGITTDTAVWSGRYFGNHPQFWLDLQSQYEIALVKRDRGALSAAARPQHARRRGKE